MKIILSRKGFDSVNGGMPSPILPDGKAFSFPIPTDESPHRFKDLKHDRYDISEIVTDLGIDLNQNVHLDPDVDADLIWDRPKGWRGAFGQVGAAQTHLAKNNVGRGDLFLFFGWFKEIEKRNGRWRYVPKAPDLHVIYGWLFVGDVLPIFGKEDEILNQYPWLINHPHLYGFNHFNNTIYLGNTHFQLGDIKCPGFGVFDCVQDVHILTDRTQYRRSLWRLPPFFMPTEQRPPLSYHGNMNRWYLADDGTVRLEAVARGQEFVLDASFYPEALGWIASLFK